MKALLTLNSHSAEIELLEPNERPREAQRQHNNEQDMEPFSGPEASAIVISICMVCGLTGVVAWLVFTHAKG